jgi:hypothetical protein
LGKKEEYTPPLPAESLLGGHRGEHGVDCPIGLIQQFDDADVLAGSARRGHGWTNHANRVYVSSQLK